VLRVLLLDPYAGQQPQAIRISSVQWKALSSARCGVGGGLESHGELTANSESSVV
jgi:hypothetical protein